MATREIAFKKEARIEPDKPLIFVILIRCRAEKDLLRPAIVRYTKFASM
jgi:hypothetical protein